MVIVRLNVCVYVCAAGGTKMDLPYGTVVHTYTLGNIHDHLSGNPSHAHDSTVQPVPAPQLQAPLDGPKWPHSLSSPPQTPQRAPHLTSPLEPTPTGRSSRHLMLACLISCLLSSLVTFRGSCDGCSTVKTCFSFFSFLSHAILNHAVIQQAAARFACIWRATPAEHGTGLCACVLHHR